MVRKAPKSRGAFSSEEAILKQIYLATMNAQTKQHGTIHGKANVRRDLEHYLCSGLNNTGTL